MAGVLPHVYEQTEETLVVLPEYRIVQAPAKGHFIGPFHAQYPNRIIPPIALEDGHRHWATTVHLDQSVSAYVGNSNLDASTHTQTVIEVGDRKTLDSILGTAGLGTNDLIELTGAIQSDGDKKIGTSVGTWINKNGPKIMSGGVKIGQELLTQWLKQYCGM
jgi:hypothetical protein